MFSVLLYRFLIQKIGIPFLNCFKPQTVIPNKKSEIGQLKWCASQCRIKFLYIKTSTTPF